MLLIKGKEYVTERMAAREIVKFWKKECVENYIECVEPKPIVVAGVMLDPLEVLQACVPDYVAFELTPTVEDYYINMITDNMIDEKVKPFRKIRVAEDWIYILPPLPKPTISKLLEIKEELDPNHFIEIEVDDLIYV